MGANDASSSSSPSSSSPSSSSSSSPSSSSSDSSSDRRSAFAALLGIGVLVALSAVVFFGGNNSNAGVVIGVSRHPLDAGVVVGGDTTAARLAAYPGPFKAAHPRLYAALALLEAGTPEDLRSPTFLQHAVRLVGLNQEDRDIYGADTRFMAKGKGLWQIPAEFASLLVVLGAVPNVTRFFDVGPLYGFTSCLFAAFLRRQDPRVRVTSVDLFVEWADAALAEQALPISYRAPATTADFSDAPVDAVFIDGDHSYDAVRADYERVGSRAKVVAFHDCFDEFVAALPGGGVGAFWRELKAAHESDPASRLYEFRHQSEGRAVFGICVLVRLDRAVGYDADRVNGDLASLVADLPPVRCAPGR